MEPVEGLSAGDIRAKQTGQLGTVVKGTEPVERLLTQVNGGSGWVLAWMKMRDGNSSLVGEGTGCWLRVADQLAVAESVPL